METSIFLAKVIGLIFIIFGVSIFIARATYQAMVKDIAAHPSVLLIGGMFNLILGVLIIVSHNIWYPDWRILITLIGWLILIRGIIWTTFPNILLSRIHRISENSKLFYISAAVCLIIGIILCYFGFAV